MYVRYNGHEVANNVCTYVYIYDMIGNVLFDGAYGIPWNMAGKHTGKHPEKPYEMEWAIAFFKTTP